MAKAISETAYARIADITAEYLDVKLQGKAATHAEILARSGLSGPEKAALERSLENTDFCLGQLSREPVAR